jgi:predicted phage terminase large subunit-like protein
MSPAPATVVTLPPLHSGQQAVADSPARFKVLAAGRRWGKTVLGVALCLEEALLGGRTWWVSKSYKTAAEGWREVKWLATQIPGSDVHEGDKILRLPGGGSMEVRSADEPGSLRGAGLDGLVLDEAAHCREEAWTHELRPALSDRKGWALFISTPNGKNWFHALWERAPRLRTWDSWQYPSWTNPALDSDEIDQARAELSADIFAQEYGAQFLDLALVRPFRRDWLVEWETCPPKDQLYSVIGVDPAISKKDTADQTAIVVVGQPVRGLDRTQAYVLEAEAGHWSPYETTNRILALTQAWKPRLIRIEDVAWQRALKDIVEREAQLRGIRLPAVDPVKPERDKLRRAMGVAPLVESGRVLFGPGQTALTRALLAVPQDSRAWDLVDAFGLAVSGLPPQGPARTLIRPTNEHGAQLAASYAVRSRVDPERAPLHHLGPSPLWRTPSGSVWSRGPNSGAVRAPDYRKRAASYARMRP